MWTCERAQLCNQRSHWGRGGGGIFYSCAGPFRLIVSAQGRGLRVPYVHRHNSCPFVVCLCPALAACFQGHLRLGPLPACHSTAKGGAQQGNVPHRTVGLVICGARAHPAACVAAGCATDRRISVSTAQAQCDQGSIRSQYACGYIVNTLALHFFELHRHNHVTHCKPSR